MKPAALVRDEAKATASSPLVSLRGVSKSFDNGTIALESLCLDVRDGEFLALLGPSGCGKSTALRLIAGLSTPSFGTIERPQKHTAGEAPDAMGRDIGYVFQEPTLMPWATVAENVALPLKLLGMTVADRVAKVEQSLEMVGLGAFRAAYPRELSGGMRMRVSIARALVTRPKLLLMDEPFAALDEITRFRLNDDLARLRAELGCTVIFVTHSVYESVYLASRIVVMAARPGRIIREIEVPAALPRTEDFRRTQDYARSCEQASEALHQAMAGEQHR